MAELHGDQERQRQLMESKWSSRLSALSTQLEVRAYLSLLPVQVAQLLEDQGGRERQLTESKWSSRLSAVSTQLELRANLSPLFVKVAELNEDKERVPQLKES